MTCTATMDYQHCRASRSIESSCLISPASILNKCHDKSPDILKARQRELVWKGPAQHPVAWDVAEGVVLLAAHVQPVHGDPVVLWHCRATEVKLQRSI